MSHIIILTSKSHNQDKRRFTIANGKANPIQVAKLMPESEGSTLKI